MDYEELSDDERQIDSVDFLNYCESDISQEEGSKHGTVNEILDSRDSGERQIIFTHHGINMFKGLKELRESEELLDLTLKVNGDNVIRAHSCVLASHSPFVRAFLRNEGINKEINLSEWSKEAIESLVNWMYDGILKIKPTKCYELLESSGYLCLNEVTQECTDYICDHLTLDNCCEAHLISCHHQMPKFKDRVKKFILTNFVELLKGNNLNQLSIEDFLSFLKDDDLLIVNNYGFAVLPYEEECILYNLLKDYIDLNRLYDLWPFIIKNVLRFGLMDKKVLQQLLSSKEWLGECKEKNLCLKYLKDIGTLMSSGSEPSAFNPKWKESRASLHSIKYFWTPMVAYFRDFPEINSISFDDVDSTINELKSSGLHPLLYVTGMKLYTNFWYQHLVISTIEVTYNTGKTVLHGNVLSNMEIHEFKLQSEERIVNIRGSTGWLIDCLQFETNFNRTFGPYGGTGGGERCFQPKSSKSYLAGLKGCVSNNNGHLYVRRLRFAWASVM